MRAKVSEVCGRVWDARREVCDHVGFVVREGQVDVVVSEDIWAELLLERDYNASVHPHVETNSPGDAARYGFKIFGLVVRPDPALPQDAVRFRFPEIIA